ncbi:hypothetical protein L7F22_033705 [Adiantum nelumboides]|nr:hypothetical protein [Adiantum nelumboides]
MIVAHGSKLGTLYTLHVSEVKNHVINVIEQPSVSLWHRRLGHMSKRGMEILSRSGYLLGFSFHNFEFCEHCVYGKQIQESHRSQGNHKDERLAFVQSDLCGPMPSLSLGGAVYFCTFIDDYSRKVCGPMPSLSLGGAVYFCTFIDDYSRKVWVYFLKHKDDVLKFFKTFLQLVVNQSGQKLRCLRTDNDGEYVSKAFQDFCEAKGIKRELTAPYNPSQTGVA